jgi:hypothetical protein
VVCALSSAPLFLAAEVFFDPISVLLGLKSQLVILILDFNLTDLLAEDFNLQPSVGWVGECGTNDLRIE